MKSEVCIILDHILFLLSAAVILLLLVCSLTYCGNVDFSTYTEKILYVHCSWKHAVCLVFLTGLCAFLMKASEQEANSCNYSSVYFNGYHSIVCLDTGESLSAGL